MAADLTVYGDTYKIAWTNSIASMTVDGLRDAPWGVEGMVTVLISAGGKSRNLWGPVKVNLTKTGEIMQLGRTLFEQSPIDGPGWPSMLRDAFGLIVTKWRDGAEMVSLVDVPESNGPRYVISDFLLDRQTTLLAADGNAGKSYFALAVGVCVATGIPILGDRLIPWNARPVLYVDWETDAEIQSDRVNRVCRGLGLMEVPDNLHYIRAARPIVDMMRALKRQAAEVEAGLIIIDSIGPACGAELEKSDTALRAMNAINELYPAARFVLAHTSKASQEQRASDRRAFGSVFFQNIPRSCWTLQRTQQEDCDEVDCALMHTKCNIGRRFSPISYRMTFSDAEPSKVEFTLTRLEDSPELADHGTLQTRIRNLMRGEGRALTAPEIATALDASQNSVRGTLRRMLEAKLVVRLGEHRDAAWGLVSQREETPSWWQ